MNLLATQKDNSEEGQIAIYQSEEGAIRVDVQVYGETVWLSLNQMAKLFERDKSVISRHLKNIFRAGELEEETVIAKRATTAADGKPYQVEYYNLEAILSVGYRVNSKRGVQFRRWASNVLKEYLIKGYSINQVQLIGERLNELRQTVEILSTALVNHNLVDSQGSELLSLIQAYAKTWDILLRYDEERLTIPDNLNMAGNIVLTYDEASTAINALKQELIKEDTASKRMGKVV